LRASRSSSGSSGRRGDAAEEGQSSEVKAIQRPLSFHLPAFAS
jgi:hypothetical protein